MGSSRLRSSWAQSRDGFFPPDPLRETSQRRPLSGPAGGTCPCLNLFMAGKLILPSLGHQMQKPNHPRPSLPAFRGMGLFIIWGIMWEKVKRD